MDIEIFIMTTTYKQTMKKKEIILQKIGHRLEINKQNLYMR